MDILNLQSQMLAALFNMGNKHKNFIQFNKLVQTVWAKPEMLNDSFRIYCNKIADFKSHNVDIPFLISFYDDMLQNLTQLQNGFLPIYNSFFTAFPRQTDLHQYVKQSFGYSRLRSFLIMIYWPPLFNTNVRRSNLLKLLKLIRLLSKDHKQCLSKWLTTMQSQKFYQTVKFLQNSLSSEILKLLPDEFDLHDPIDVSQCLMLLSEGIALFSRSNQIFKRIQSKYFKNNDVMKYFSHNDQFNLHIRKIRLLNFIQYPFLLDLSYKNRLLQIQNHYQHQQIIQKGLRSLLQDQINNSEQVVINQATIKRFYLQLQINRNNILEDSINQITNTNLSLKNPLKISFVGQPGDDAGGVKKEYFQLLIKSIFNEKNNDMFRIINNNSFYWFNGLSKQNLIMFQFVGIVLGLSIYNNTLLDIKLPRLIYKKLICQDQSKLDFIEELGQIDPDLQKTLKYLIETKDSLQPLELYFEASVINNGKIVNFDLKPNGSYIKLTQNNKNEYINKMSKWFVNLHIQNQFNAFKKGFLRVVTGDMIKLFSAQQLEKIICGSNDININELKNGARYGGGFNSDTQIIKYLWQILEQFNNQQRKSFLSFATGSDRIPVGGLSSLKFIIERHTSDSQMLPSSRTCSNLLLIPEYESKQKLKRKLLLSIQYKQGFGLI